MEFSRTRWRRPGGGPGGEARGRQPWHGPPQPPSPASCVLTRLLPQPRNKAPALLAVSGSQVRWDTFPAQPGPLKRPVLASGGRVQRLGRQDRPPDLSPRPRPDRCQPSPQNDRQKDFPLLDDLSSPLRVLQDIVPTACSVWRGPAGEHFKEEAGEWPLEGGVLVQMPQGRARLLEPSGASAVGVALGL